AGERARAGERRAPEPPGLLQRRGEALRSPRGHSLWGPASAAASAGSTGRRSLGGGDPGGRGGALARARAQGDPTRAQGDPRQRQQCRKNTRHRQRDAVPTNREPEAVAGRGMTPRAGHLFSELLDVLAALGVWPDKDPSAASWGS